MNTMRYAIFEHLKTSALINKVYLAEERVMSPEQATEAYVVLGEQGSQLNSTFLDNAGEYIFRITVHVLPGQVDQGEEYLQSLTELFRGNISVEDGDPAKTYYYRPRISDWTAWSLEEIDKTIARSRLLVVPAWG